jgi:hypothetical protein
MGVGLLDVRGFKIKPSRSLAVIFRSEADSICLFFVGGLFLSWMHRKGEGWRLKCRKIRTAKTTVAAPKKVIGMLDKRLYIPDRGSDGA